MECSGADGGGCGNCRTGEVCSTEGRCYRFFGMDQKPWPQQPQGDLGRGLQDSPEGMECVVDTDGDLERVEAQHYTDGTISALVMNVYAPCGGNPLAHVAEVRHPIRSGEAESISSWTLERPIAVKKGATIRAMFHAEGASTSRLATQSILRKNVDPACRFVAPKLQVPGNENWELMGRIGIRTR